MTANEVVFSFCLSPSRLIKNHWVIFVKFWEMVDFKTSNIDFGGDLDLHPRIFYHLSLWHACNMPWFLHFTIFCTVMCNVIRLPDIVIGLILLSHYCFGFVSFSSAVLEAHPIELGQNLPHVWKWAKFESACPHPQTCRPKLPIFGRFCK